MMKLIWLVLAAIGVILMHKQCCCVILTEENCKYLQFIETKLASAKFIEEIQRIGNVFGTYDISGRFVSFDTKSRTYKLTNKVLDQGKNTLILLGFIVELDKPDVEHAVAVKVESYKRSEVIMEYKIYKHLIGGREGLEESQECLLKVYRLAKKWTIGSYQVNAMFMQLAGLSLRAYSMLGRDFSTKEVDAIGIKLIDCVNTIHEHGVIVNDVKMDNILTGFGLDNSRLFVADFGAAVCSGIKDIPDQATLTYCSPRVLRLINGKDFPPAIKMDDFFSLLVTVIELSGVSTEIWDPDPNARILSEGAKSVLEKRKMWPIKAMCRLDATGTLSKFWSLIKNNLDEPIVPKDNIKKVFEDNLNNYLRETPDFVWRTLVQKTTNKRAPFVRPLRTIEEKLPKSFGALYHAIVSSDEIVIAGNYEVLIHLIDWGSSSLIFLGKSKSDGTYVAIKIQKKPGTDLNKLKNQYETIMGMETSTDHITSAHVPKMFGFEESLVLKSRCTQDPKNKYVSHDPIKAQALVMELLGPSIKTLLQNYRFSLKTMNLISIQVVEFLQLIHDRYGIVMNQLEPAEILTELNGDGIKFIGFGHSSKMRQEVFVQIDSLAFAPKDYLEKMAEVDIGLVAPNSLHDYESYFYVLLHFIEGSCSWDAFELQDMSVFAKARKILEERTDYQFMKLYTIDESSMIRFYHDELLAGAINSIQNVFEYSLKMIHEKSSDKTYVWTYKLEKLRDFEHPQTDYPEEKRYYQRLFCKQHLITRKVFNKLKSNIKRTIPRSEVAKDAIDKQQQQILVKAY